MSLAGAVALVTGGNTGIGAAVSRRLASDGARVAIGYVEEPEEAHAIAERLAGEQPCVAVACDVTDEASVGTAVERIEADLGAVTVLVNNAAILIRAPFLDTDDPTFARTIDVAVRGSARCARLVIPGMLRAGGGAIVNVASELVNLGGTEHAAYVTAKAGVVGLTRALAREFGPSGIRVNAVAPGPTRTRMLGDAATDPGSLAAIPLRRVGRPEDVAGAVAFLVSEDAAWITGQVVGVNGGLVMAG